MLEVAEESLVDGDGLRFDGGVRRCHCGHDIAEAKRGGLCGEDFEDVRRIRGERENLRLKFGESAR
jgi:hypothetical protein